MEFLVVIIIGIVAAIIKAVQSGSAKEQPAKWTTPVRPSTMQPPKPVQPSKPVQSSRPVQPPKAPPRPAKSVIPKSEPERVVSIVEVASETKPVVPQPALSATRSTPRFTKKELAQGVLMREILGPPRAKSRYRYRPLP